MDGLRMGVVRGISYGLFGPPDGFVPEARALGAGLIRAYVFWGQVEREPGADDWTAVDALLAQLDRGTDASGTDGDGTGGDGTDGDGTDGGEEVWLTVCSSSPWATRVPTDFLPPSPARDLDAYAAFVERLVRRCRGRIRYWQCDNEPSNTALLWSGTAEEYVTQLGAFSAAVRRADPDALVVLGGCGYDVLSSPEGSEPRRFFDHLVDAGRDAFDLFDVHLYGDPNAVPGYVAQAREMMAAHGYAKPVVAGEQGGPVLFEFDELEPIVARTFAAAFAEAPATQRPMTQRPMTQSTGELIERAGQETPERRAMRALYARASELPPRLRMLMDGCEPELEARRHRINCRQLVVRSVLAAAAGLRRTAYWQLAPEVPGASDPYQMMHLLFGKLPLLAYDADRHLTRRQPAAVTFALLADRLAGATGVTRLDTPDHPALRAFRAERPGRGPLLVAWVDADPFDGEDLPPVAVELPWDGPAAGAVDALGNPRRVDMCAGTVRFDGSVTPLLVE